MSFTLKSVELNNIRAHEHFLFEPALVGITAISGENGTGKSTIVDAFAWSLYGTRPSGVKNKNLIKEGVDPKEDKVSVKANLLVGGIEYSIERKILNAQGTTECNVWGRKPGSQEFTQVAGPSVSHVEKFLKSELGMNEKGFLTSIFVQQKQVDQIVSATPRERGAVIEDLTGIASITQAIQKTNENTRALEKAISIFQIGNVEEAEEKVAKQTKVCEEVEARQLQAVDKFNKMKIEYKNLKEDLDFQQKKVDQKKHLERKIEALKGQVEFLKKQAEDDLAYIASFKEKYGTTVYSDIKQSKKELENKRSESYNIQSQGLKIKDQLQTLKENIQKCKVLKRHFEKEKEAESELNSLNEKLENIEKELGERKDKKAVLMAEIKNKKNSHKHIHGEDKHCPVCKSPIENPEELKKEIEAETKELQQEQKENDEKIKSLILEVSELEQAIKGVSISIEAIKEEKVLLTKQKELITQFKELQTQHEILDLDVKTLEKEYDKALKIEADKSSLESAKTRSLTVNKRIDELNEQIAQLSEDISKLEALSDRSLSALSTRTNDAQSKLTKMSIAGKELMGRKKLELERLEDNKASLKSVQDALKRYNEIADQIEVSTSASTMLAAFKADRIENAIPTLEFYASDFLSKFTGGAFSKLSMDEKFNTFVTTSNGMVRPVAQLSGGELSAAAIALRLGIAMLLNSSENNVLILDEVLVSMDEDRSRQIMETIGALVNSQIIFIAHNSDINSVADKTVLVTKGRK